MQRRDILCLATALILIICLIFATGCTSIPGPEPRQKTTLEKTPVPVSPPAKTLGTKTTLLTPTLQPATQPVTVKATPSTTPQGTYELRNCAQQKGAIAMPGERCPGTWLAAVDTFSCCSEKPVPALDRNTTITIQPLDLVLVMDDDPGIIIP